MSTRHSSKVPLVAIILLLAANATQAQDATASNPNSDLQIIDLPAALRLAGDNSLDIALVRQSLAQAEALNDAATLRFFPWIAPSIGYSAHNGALQDVTGNILSINKQLYSNTAAITAQVNLGEAIYEKLVAKQNLAAASFNLDARKNDTLSAAAYAYFQLVNAVSNVEIAREALRISQDYESQLAQAFSIGIATKSDQLRVSVQSQRYQIDLRQMQEQQRIAAASLAQILHLNIKASLTPADKIAPDIALIPRTATLDSLVTDALAARPELKGSAASIAAADLQRSEATYGPLIPSVSAQAAFGQIQGGVGSNFSGAKGAQDYALMLNWRIGPGGLFDFSRTDMAESKFAQSQLTDAKLRDEITHQVVTAYELVQSASEQAKLAQSSLDLSQQSLTFSQQRKEFGVAAVLEVIQAQKDFTQARIDFAKARTQYAEAQYALARAVARIGN
jgi:outer membrane protein TolC